MTALNLDMADWWEATPENYLSHVSKDRILELYESWFELSSSFPGA